VANDRLRATLRSNGFTVERFSEELEVASKTVQRWITADRTPHRTTAFNAARLLSVPPNWLWPELDEVVAGPNTAEVVAHYSHRSDTPNQLWMDLLLGAQENIDLFANASLFLTEDNPEAIEIIKYKAARGVRVRVLLGDPDSPAMALRGHEERLYDAIPGRIRMALAYYRRLVGADGVEFRLHSTALYNSIFRYDHQMLVNQHIYGTYGYMAPILHLRRTDGGLFDMYQRSFELVWNEESNPYLPK
jgi:phosphatidylserine/phosphatidylglycerophosphate/cardiolipin synthase-like enzyme